MAVIKISEMTEAIILQDEDYLPILQSNLNKKVKIELLRDYNKLHNKPILNGVTIENSKTIFDYNIVKENQGIQINEDKKTLELETLGSIEIENRADVNKAVTIKTADKTAKETAHQDMSKEYNPNGQTHLSEGENQPVSYKAVKEYVDTLESKVDANEEDIENKHAALESKVDENERDIEDKVQKLDEKTAAKDAELEETINTNEQDIEQKVSNLDKKTSAKDQELEELINTNEDDIEQKVSDLKNTVNTNETDIEQKLSNLNTAVQENKEELDGKIEIIEEDITNLENKDLEIIDNIDTGGRLSIGNEFHGATGDYGLEVDYIKGAYKQVETKGYQLFDASKLQTKTHGGATVTNNGDGSFTISGSGNMTQAYQNNYNIAHEEMVKLFKAGKVYCIVDKATSPYFYVNLNKSNQFLSTLLDTTVLTKPSFDMLQEYLDDETYTLTIGINGNNNGVITTGTIKPMLYQDGDGTFEPFTGGQPSPNPEYPQEPEFTKIENFYTSGRNLFDFTYLKNSDAQSGTKTYTDNSITLISTGSDCYDSSYYNPSFKIAVIPNTEYSLLFKTTTQTNIGFTYIFFRDKEGTDIGYTPYNTNKTNMVINFTTPENCYYISFRNGLFNSGQTCTFSDFMVLQGTHTWDGISEFIPYQSSSQSPTSVELRALPDGTADTYEDGVITRNVAVYEVETISKIITLENGLKCAVIYISNKSHVYNNLKSFLVTNLIRSNYSNKLTENTIYQNLDTFVIVGNSEDTLETLQRFVGTKIWYKLATPTIEYLALPTLPSYYPYTNAWHDATVEPSEMRYRVKSYDALLEQNKFVEEDYIKLTETDDMVSTSSNRGGAELLYIEGAYKQDTTNGYQLFDASKIPTKSQGGATVTNNGDGSFTISGSGNLSERFYKEYRYTVEEVKKLGLKAGTIYLKQEMKTKPNFIFGIYSSAGEFVNVLDTDSGNEISKTITEEQIQKTLSGEYTLRIAFFGMSEKAIKSGTIKPMVYQDGDGTWEPFTGGEPSPNPNYKQEMKCVDVDKIYSRGKNLFDGKFELGMIDDGNDDFSDRNVRSGYIKVKDNTEYCFSINGKLNRIIVCCYDDNKNYLDKTYIGIQAKNGVFTTLEKTSFIRIRSYSDDFSLFSNESNVYQLELGDTPQPYTPYQDSTTSFPLLLRALPDGTKDTYENGVLTRRVGEAIFDGSSDENWILGTNTTDNSQQFYIRVSNATTNTINIMCNRFKPKNTASYGICRFGGDFNIYLKTEQASTVEELKTWLQLNPVMVWYPLATPTIEIIDKPFIETYYPWTNIWHDSEIKSHMKIGFKNRFGEFYTKKEVDELIKQAIATIGTQLV